MGRDDCELWKLPCPLGSESVLCARARTADVSADRRTPLPVGGFFSGPFVLYARSLLTNHCVMCSANIGAFRRRTMEPSWPTRSCFIHFLVRMCSKRPRRKLKGELQMWISHLFSLRAHKGNVDYDIVSSLGDCKIRVEVLSTIKAYSMFWPDIGQYHLFRSSTIGQWPMVGQVCHVFHSP